MNGADTKPPVDETLVAEFMADLRNGSNYLAVRSRLFQPSTVDALDEAYRRFTEKAPDDLSILREYRAAQQAAIDEVFGLSAPPSETSIAQLAVIIREDPVRAATRWLNLEAQVKIMRAHQETFEIRLLAMRGQR